jgi:hypothetical protein
MKVDPNRDVGMTQEYILCEGGRVVLHDGSSTERSQLSAEDSAFQKFCSTLDPNRCFIVALIPDDADRSVFYRARELAAQRHIHMQSPVDTKEHLMGLWRRYRQMKQSAASSPDRRPEPEGKKG